jgi:hypothetical protein
LLKVIAESDLEDARKANWLIRPLGCREKRAPTWRYGRALYPACPPWRAARFAALVIFICI